MSGRRDPFEEFVRDFFANDPFFGGERRGDFGFFRDPFFSDRRTFDERPNQITNFRDEPRQRPSQRIEEPSEPSLWQRMANGSRNILNRMFGGIDDEHIPSQNTEIEQWDPWDRRPVRRAPDLGDLWNSRTDGFFGDRRDNNLHNPGRRGFFNNQDGAFLEFPNGEERQLPRTMFKSYSVSTTRGPDGERLTTTTVRDENGTRTTVTKEDGTVIEGDPADIPDIPNMLGGPGGFGGLLGSFFGDAFGQRLPQQSIQRYPREPTGNSSQPPSGLRESIFTREFLDKETNGETKL